MRVFGDSFFLFLLSSFDPMELIYFRLVTGRVEDILKVGALQIRLVFAEFCIRKNVAV